MKKIASMLLALVLTVSCLATPAFAAPADTIPPADGTVTAVGIYGDVEDIGLAPSQNARTSIYYTTVNLASGGSFTSYQYQVTSSYINVAAGLLPMTSGTKFKVEIYGSNTVGGTKTLVASKEASYSGTSVSDMVSVVVSRKYTYYNFVVRNTGTKTGNCYIEFNKN